MRYTAQDLAIGLLKEAAKAAGTSTCGDCATRISQDRDFATYFDKDTKVLIRDGSNAHSCTGCVCAVSQIAGLLSSLHDVTKFSRSVTKSYPPYAIVEDHLLHSGSKSFPGNDDETAKLHTAFVTELDADMDACVPASGLSVKKAILGDVSTVVYIVDVNELDNTVGRITVYILDH